ncbi:MAG: hypothetical protein J6V37_01380 [Clostridia bacterium]|nr:hypothetical protein [Clostridia bacterium]
MNFDDRFLGILNMLGSMNGASGDNKPNSYGQGASLDGMMKIIGLMQGLQGFSSGQNLSGNQGNSNNQGFSGNLGAKGQSNNNGGLDIMKILPLLSALKGGFPMSNTPINNTNLTTFGDTNIGQENHGGTDNNITAMSEKQNGYKDKYSAISFAGNEVIYTIGKLWKTYKE